MTSLLEAQGGNNNWVLMFQKEKYTDNLLSLQLYKNK